MTRLERRFQLTLHYDGSDFFGWQVQPELRTVQGELEATLAHLTGALRRVTAAGRTDRGVHATGQVVAVTLPGRWNATALRKALNAKLPSDIWVADVAAAAPGLHPRYDAVARRYEYRLGLDERARSPFHRGWCWPLDTSLETDLLHQAAALLPGDRSFAAFARSGQKERGDRCIVLEAYWMPWKLGVSFTITANRFLHHMVRYLVGTMVDIGCGRRPLHDMQAMLADHQPSPVTSPPAPPAGLFLRRVSYPAEEVEPLHDADAPDVSSSP